MNDPVQALATFRERRDAAAVQPRGPLALVNTQWVDMSQTIWGVPGTWAPREDGGSGLVLTASAEDNISVDGEPAVGEVLVLGGDNDEP